MLTRSSFAQNRRDAHLRRATRHYAKATETLRVARMHRDQNRPAIADMQVRIARGWGRAARAAIRSAYEAR